MEPHFEQWARLCLPAIALAMLMGCASALTVNQRTLIQGEIGNWQDYAWAEPLPAAGDTRINTANQLIRKEVDATLAAKGYQLTSKAQADFLVRHAISAHWETRELSGREERAMKEQAMIEDERLTDLETGPRATGEGLLYVFLLRPDGKTVWEGLVETPLNYEGQGAKKIPLAVSELLSDLPSR